MKRTPPFNCSKKSIRPYNAEGERHGYYVDYWDDGSVFIEGTYHNGIRYGYYENNTADDFCTKEYVIL